MKRACIAVCTTVDMYPDKTEISFMKKVSSCESALYILMQCIIYYRELAPGTVSLTGDRVHGDDSKQNVICSITVFRVTSLKGVRYPFENKSFTKSDKTKY